MKTVNGGLFDTVADKDYLNCFRNKKPQYGRIKDLLQFKKEDISKAIGIPLESVRFDERIPKEVRERMTEWANALNLVAGHFNGNPVKTILWFTTSNPLLGDIAPRDMIRLGRYKKLFKFILSSLSENKR